jgi:hypothetical protein
VPRLPRQELINIINFKNMTQQNLILEYIKEHGSILPAKMGGYVYKGIMMGSESTARCRELRAKGILEDFKDGKFVGFKLKESQFVKEMREIREKAMREREEKGQVNTVLTNQMSML